MTQPWTIRVAALSTTKNNHRLINQTKLSFLARSSHMVGRFSQFEEYFAKHKDEGSKLLSTQLTQV